MYAPVHAPTTPIRSKLQDQVFDWLCRMTPSAADDHCRFAVTLTFDGGKMLQRSPTGALTKCEALAFAQGCFKKFRLSLDRRIFKSAASRHGKELTYIPVIEGQGGGELIHYHCVIVAPSWVSLDHMSAAVKAAWMSTAFAGFEIDVQSMRDDGWLAYISKEAWTLRQDSVDISNVRLSATPKRC